MRIGIITGEYPPLQGGVGAYTNVLSRVLCEQGYDIFILGEGRAQQQHNAIPLTAHNGTWGYSAIRAIQQWANVHRLDIVNMQFQTTAYQMSPWVHFLPHFLSVPFVTTFHDLRFPYLFPKAGKLRDWIVMHLARASDAVIITDHEDYARVAHLPCVKVIPIGSNIRPDMPNAYDKAAWREKAGAASDDFLLAYFGFINHSKGVDTLLQGLARVNNPHIKLAMIGGKTGTADPTNADYATTIDRLTHDLKLLDSITWTGFVDDSGVSAYLRAADVVVLPYRDGASYRRGTLMAAIQHECAIITTHPAYPESPFTHDNMLLVPPENPDALARAIQSAHENPSLITQLRENVAQLKQLFDWQSIAQQYIRLFEQVVGQAR